MAIARILFGLLALALLAGCPGNRKPDPPVVPQIVEVPVKEFVSVPKELTGDCQNDRAKEQTYVEAKRLALLRNEFLDECTGRMRKIRALK